MAGIRRLVGVPTFFDLLMTADGSNLIQDCWGEVPRFTFGDVLHFSQVADAAGAATVRLTADMVADDGSDPDGPEDLSQCKPSRVVVEFGGVTHCEYFGAFASHPANGIALASVFTDPPAGQMIVGVMDMFYIACRHVRVVSCDIIDLEGVVRVGAA